MTSTYLDRHIGPDPLVVTIAGDVVDRIGPVTIRHGKADPDGQPEAASCTLAVELPQTAELPQVGDQVAVELGASAVAAFGLVVDDPALTRFVGQVTDAKAELGAGDAPVVVGLVAVSKRARLGRVYVGDEPWPAELDGARASRILNLAGAAGYEPTPGYETFAITYGIGDIDVTPDHIAGVTAQPVGEKVTWEAGAGAGDFGYCWLGYTLPTGEGVGGPTTIRTDPTRVGETSGQADAGDLVLAMPAGTTAGDYGVILHAANVASSTMNVPAGWTPVTAAVAGNLRLAVLVKELAGETDVTLNLTGGGKHAGALHVVRGVDPASPIADADQVGDNVTSTTDQAAPDLSLPAPAFVIEGWAERSSASSTSATVTGSTLRTDEFNTGGGAVCLVTSDDDVQAAGVHAGSSASWSATNTAHAAVAIALNGTTVDGPPAGRTFRISTWVVPSADSPRLAAWFGFDDLTTPASVGEYVTPTGDGVTPQLLQHTYTAPAEHGPQYFGGVRTHPDDVRPAGSFVIVRSQLVVEYAGGLPSAGVLDPGIVTVVGRDVDRQPALGLLDELAGESAGTLAELRAGDVEWHDSEHRRNAVPAVTLTADQVLQDSASWEQSAGGMVNDLTIAYGPTPTEGARTELRVTDQTAVNRFGIYGARVDSQLDDEASARLLAQLTVGRRGRPRWRLDSLTVDLVRTVPATVAAELLRLEFADLVAVTGFPVAGPFVTRRLWVEGWTEQITANGWRLALAVSDYAASSPPTRWADLPAALTWSAVDPDLSWLGAAAHDFGGDALVNDRWLDQPSDLRWSELDPAATWTTYETPRS